MGPIPHPPAGGAPGAAGAAGASARRQVHVGPYAGPATKVEEYAVDLEVDPETERFHGTVTVALRDAGAVIELDAAGLEVHRATCRGAEVPYAVDEPRQKIVLRPPVTGDLPIRIEYAGAVRRDVMNGFYVSRFGEHKLFTTMMQPLGCRWLFPCVDHPASKAVVRLTVATDPDLTVIANADVASVSERDGRKVWAFAPTPPMSTYLVYLGIGPFDRVSTTYEGIRVGVAAAPGKAAEGSRALALAGPVLRGYEEYYRRPYPFRKLDLIAVPDFWAGGMENWGAITFPEVGVLWGETTSPAIVRWAIETLTHEIAHQWFGNLVTMEWWTDIWLNESFTTFVAAKMSDRLHLRRDAWGEFLIRASPGYFADSQRSTHAIKLTIRDPSEISQSVDDITYFKGANIVRMLEAFLGEEPFRRGVTAYLEKFQYANAKDDDLWRSFEGSSDQPVRRVMGAWIDRPGFPVIEVRRRPDGFRLTQRRFSFLPSETTDPPWPIPLTYRLDGASDRCLFEGAELDLPATGTELPLLNPGRSAFLRVWYEPSLRPAAVARLASLDPIDRWAFVSDSLAFLLSGDLSLGDYLEVVEAVKDAVDYPTVAETTASLHSLRPLLRDLPAFQRTYTAYHRVQGDRLGLDARPGEPDTDPVLRETVLAGRVPVDPELARSLAGRFGEIDRVPGAIRPAVLRAYARTGGPGVVDGLFAHLTSQTSDDLAERAAYSIGSLPTEALLRDALGRLSNPAVRTVHTCYALRSVAGNPLGWGPAWEWLAQNLRQYEKRAEGSWWLSNLLNFTLPTVGLGREAEVRTFFARESFPEGTRGLHRGLEMLEVLGAVRRRAGIPA